MAQRVFALILIAATGVACRTAGGGSTASPAPAPQARSQPATQDAPPQIMQPGAPGKAGRVIAVDQATDLSRVQHTDADVKFMQGMIGHHQQAIEMTNLLKTRTASEDMKKLALRIDVSQADEINMMKRWLEVRGQEIPSEHAMHMHGATLMPGMLTPEEMEKLAAAKGVDFDRLFLEGMIKHHGGAISMVKDLFSTPGAGQEAEIFAFASDVDSDQRMEIDRMGAMLNAIMKERK
jgi:uncharacterized protein (DUF305 family)